MTPEQVTQLIEYLKNMGELAVSKGFELAVKQVYVQMVGDALILMFGLMCLGATIWCIKKKIANARSDWEIVAAIFGLLSITIPFGIYGIASKLINPEWYAIKMMFDLVTGG